MSLLSLTCGSSLPFPPSDPKTPGSLLSSRLLLFFFIIILFSLQLYVVVLLVVRGQGQDKNSMMYEYFKASTFIQYVYSDESILKEYFFFKEG